MALAITSFTPSTASTAGGTLVTITGTDLNTVDVVSVDTGPAQIVSQNATTLIFRAPGHSAGTTKVVVQDNAAGVVTSVVSTASLTYAVPAATSPVSTPTFKFAVEVDSDPNLASSDVAAKASGGWLALFGLTGCAGIQREYDQVETTTSDDFDPATGLVWKSTESFNGSWSITGTIARKAQSGAYHPSQQILQDAFESNTPVRIRDYDRSGVTGARAHVGIGKVTAWTETTGDTNAPSTVQFTISGQGQASDIAVPA